MVGHVYFGRKINKVKLEKMCKYRTTKIDF